MLGIGHPERAGRLPGQGAAHVDALRQDDVHFGLVLQRLRDLVQRSVLLRREDVLQRVDIDVFEVLLVARQEREGRRHDFQQYVADRLQHDLAVGELRRIETPLDRKVHLHMAFLVFQDV